ncbi:hypothetical protein FSP39_022434 [Pinctada imbricata]|uniref:Uncharacterized protein n=1 Tax=Pinctada imbricata TaxID=66713 RepID=A0AA88Y815_PINIB|nr:hypothetical protein FSP39_022434 [Pinctada imbricata]
MGKFKGKRKKFAQESSSGSEANSRLSLSGLLNETNSVLFAELNGQTMNSQQQMTSTPLPFSQSSQQAAYQVPGSVTFLPPQNQPGFAPVPSAPQWALDIVNAVRSLDKKVEDVSKKLEKLECLEAQVSGLGTKIKGLEDEVASVKKDVVTSMKKTKDLVDALNDRADNADFQVGDLGDRVNALETQNEEMKWQLIDTRARSMRDNLLFSGIAEVADVTPDKTEELLRGFMMEKLRMASELVEAIKFDRVHRIGGQGRPRVIVAKFKDFKQRQDVRAKSSALKGSNYYINEQFPPEIVERSLGS